MQQEQENARHAAAMGYIKSKTPLTALDLLLQVEPVNAKMPDLK